ncbi:MAG: tetratricopeptide repeat protein [Akkermansiaceae bacterium]
MNYLVINCCLLTCLSLTAAEPLVLSKDYWKDEAFLSSFNGSYRINARIEPSVTSEERSLLVKIQPLMAKGEREAALEMLNSNELAKSSAAIAFNIGNIYFELGKLKSAEQSYLKALKEFPSFRRAHRNLGFVYVRESDWAKALPSLEESIRLGDHDGATFGQLAFGRMQMGQYASALQAFQLAQLTQPDAIDWKAGTAQCLEQLKRFEEALLLLDEVIEARPTEASYYLLQASVYLAMSRPDDAISNLELVRRLGKLDAENHLLLANLHLRAGSAALARPVMMTAISMDKKGEYTTVVNLLEFVTATRNWSLARDYTLAIKKAYPNPVDVLLEQKMQYLTAYVDIESGDQTERGANILQGLIKQAPLSAEALILLARHRAKKQKYEEALMLLKQASRVEGHVYSAQVELAKVCVATRRYSAALGHLDKALKISSSEELLAYREAIRSLSEASE